MMCAIYQQGGVSLCKALFYKTAVIGPELGEGLTTILSAEGLKAGDVVEVQYAWRAVTGEAHFYFGRIRGHWLGVSGEAGLKNFCL